MKYKTLMREAHRSLWLEGTNCNQEKNYESSRDHEPPRCKEYDRPSRDDREQLVPVSGVSPVERDNRAERYSHFDEARLGDHGGDAAYPPPASFDPAHLEDEAVGSPAPTQIKEEPLDNDSSYNPEQNREMPGYNRNIVNLHRMAQLYRQAAALQMGMMQYGYNVPMARADMYDSRATPIVPWPMVMPMFVPNAQLYPPTVSPLNQELDDISREILDEDQDENRRIKVESPNISPMYGRNIPNTPFHKTPKRPRSVTPPPTLSECTALPSTENLSIPALKTPKIEDQGTPWMPAMLEDFQVKTEVEEEDEAVGPVRRTRSKRIYKAESSIDSQDEGQDEGMYPRYYECGACSLRMRSHQGLNKHFLSHGTNLPKTPAVCGVCREEFNNAFELDHHVRMHDEAGKELLQRRRAERGARRRHVCHHCGKSLAKRHSLIEHLRIHTGEKPYTCEHCQESFRSWAMYLEHKRRHRGMKYKCTNCKMEFKDQYYLQMHSCSLDFMLQS